MGDGQGRLLGRVQSTPARLDAVYERNNGSLSGVVFGLRFAGELLTLALLAVNSCYLYAGRRSA